MASPMLKDFYHYTALDYFVLVTYCVFNVLVNFPKISPREILINLRKFTRGLYTSLMFDRKKVTVKLSYLRC